MGSVKFVCFIASAVIVLGLLKVGETIVAWLDYKINGTCIPCHLELINSIYHLISILINGLLLHGIRKGTSRFMSLYLDTHCHDSLQVNLLQKHLFLHQLTHNMTKDYS